jgi:RNA polymerase sigma-70 factor (ECF subfamily)
MQEDGAVAELAIRAHTMTSCPETDERLLEHLARGDPGPLVSLYDRHARALFAFLCRLTGDEIAAEDLLQETFVGAWHSAPTFQGRSSVRTWLFGIAHNKAGHWLRRRRPRSLDENECENLLDPGPAVSEMAEAAWRRERVAAALARLPAPQREVLELTFFHGLSCAEVAEAMDCPIGTVKSRAHLARKRLARMLADLADAARGDGEER